MTGAVFGAVGSYLNPPVSAAVRPFSVTTTSTGPAMVLAGVFAVTVSLPRTRHVGCGLPPTDMVVRQLRRRRRVS